MKSKIVVLSGAGISAESGLKTFRDEDGLWEGYNVYDVATPEAWSRNPTLVLNFYNERRKAVNQAVPNLAHKLIAKLDDYFEVKIITQNIDDLHEKAGSKNIIHLHGQINQSRSTQDPNRIYPILGDNLNWGETCDLGSPLRPNIVWFGEDVPLINLAAAEVETADILIVIGTSLQVYPAAGLVRFFNSKNKLFVVDPKTISIKLQPHHIHYQMKAGEGMQKIFAELVG